MFQALYPDVEEDRDDEKCEHPMTAVGLVLLSAAIIGRTEVAELTVFTGYSRRFISAITSNMQNNRLWIDGRYDVSAWLSPDGAIDEVRFWDHIEFACGTMWRPVVDTHIS